MNYELSEIFILSYAPCMEQNQNTSLGDSPHPDLEQLTQACHMILKNCNNGLSLKFMQHYVWSFLSSSFDGQKLS